MLASKHPLMAQGVHSRVPHAEVSPRRPHNARWTPTTPACCSGRSATSTGTTSACPPWSRVRRLNPARRAARSDWTTATTCGSTRTPRPALPRRQTGHRGAQDLAVAPCCVPATTRAHHGTHRADVAQHVRRDVRQRRGSRGARRRPGANPETNYQAMYRRGSPSVRDARLAEADADDGDARAQGHVSARWRRASRPTSTARWARRAKRSSSITRPSPAASVAWALAAGVSSGCGRPTRATR
jgi:hypothetical protein